MRTAKPRTAGGALGGLIGAIIMSVVAGVLVTVAVTPVVAVSGMAATSAISIFENLPNHINPGQLAQPSVILAKTADGSEVQLATFYQQNREMVGWDDISQYVKDAAVAAEDRNFYTHGGVDIVGLGRAVLGQVTGSSSSGASTITMQYVRNVLVQQAEAILDEEEREAAYEDAMRQDVDRKLQEIRYAVSIEKKYSKDEILLGYLNIALSGRNVYGIESAAQSYYGKSAKDLTLPEAASLVAIVQFPSSLNLGSEDNIAANQERRDWILGQMLSEKRITQEQYDEAIATDVVPNLTPRQTGCTVAEQNYGLGHF
ncbi:MAG: penicillin-binding protein, partial [Microbacteriaceae bacterium]|nr:penicillin-binding protein [Microbacteriaceae bacterium]